jgi:hypothetical protein
VAEHRFRADTRLAYSQALLAVVRHARGSEQVFFYGPRSLARLEKEGLLLSGPGADGAAEAVRYIPGLVETEA